MTERGNPGGCLFALVMRKDNLIFVEPFFLFQKNKSKFW